MLMMVDPDVHFHVIPRYEGARDWDGLSFRDAGWPALPALAEAVALDEAHGRAPGALLRGGRDGLDVACGEGALRIRVLQREGGKPITAADYLNARRDLVA